MRFERRLSDSLIFYTNFAIVFSYRLVVLYYNNLKNIFFKSSLETIINLVNFLKISKTWHLYLYQLCSYSHIFVTMSQNDYYGTSRGQEVIIC